MKVRIACGSSVLPKDQEYCTLFNLAVLDTMGAYYWESKKQKLRGEQTLEGSVNNGVFLFALPVAIRRRNWGFILMNTLQPR
ncbi:hypothetical protein [Paenibacillus sp.]|uniref:hypothetical protein n=1 Tax=Paenibacillus sp. TaxID=58172 RepID=UPI002D53F58D|nr:hypothetical protein [Paenibacillus sp.]HZG84914.1 hypothetical protein [Paenibacillus sp.]